MPKTSAKTFLVLLRKLNTDMEHLTERGMEIIKRVNEVDIESITGPSMEEELVITYNEIGDKFRELHDMKKILLNGLQRKVIQELDAATPSVRTKSLTMKRNSLSSRNTRRIRTL
jgi:hypothetical protein